MAFDIFKIRVPWQLYFLFMLSALFYDYDLYFFAPSWILLSGWRIRQELDGIVRVQKTH